MLFLQMTQSVDEVEFLEESTLQFDLRTPEVVDVTQRARNVRLTFEMRHMTDSVGICQVNIYNCFVRNENTVNIFSHSDAD